MEIAEYIDALEGEADPFAHAVEAAGLEAKVPTCPDWTVRELVRHMGGVHRWAAQYVREARTEQVDAELEELVGGWPDDAELVTWLRDGLGALVEALRAAPPDLECLTFLAAPSPLAMWARRQAHETTIHRIDAQSAAGRMTDPEPRLATDGIDELLSCFITRPRTRLRLDPARTIDVATTDTAETWSVEVGPTQVTTQRVASPGPDAAIRGPAASLYLFLWNRKGPDGLAVEGDTSLLDVWRDTVTVRWS